jgi:hypothetical protein
MCFGGGGGGGAPDNSAQIRAQDESLKLQREQMAMQKQQMDAQQAQYQEQLAVSRAAPPPAPNPVAQAAMSTLERGSQPMVRSALEMPAATGAAGTDAAMATTVQQARAGVGRRRLRTDLASRGLNIPGVM